MDPLEFARKFGILPQKHQCHALESLQSEEFASFQAFARQSKKFYMFKVTLEHAARHPEEKILFMCATDTQANEMRELCERFCSDANYEVQSMQQGKIRGEGLASPPVIDELDDDDDGEEWKR